MTSTNDKPITADTPTAGRVLKRIIRRYPGKLTLTGSLVIAENALDLFYPLAAGIAIDAVIAGDLPRAMLMVAIIFGFWLIGAIRKAVDTRVYARIYADLAGDVIAAERQSGVDTSTAIVHTALTRQFVDFFEIQLPIFATALVSIVGSVAMLLVLEPDVGALSLGLLLVSTLAATRYMRVSEFIAACLHSRQEHEPRTVTDGSPIRIARHFRVLAGRRVQLSDMEASAYVFVGIVAAALFAVLFYILSGRDAVTAGMIYTLMSYIWTFVFSLDDLPVHLQSISKLRELGRRIDTGMTAPVLA